MCFIWLLSSLLGTVSTNAGRPKGDHSFLLSGGNHSFLNKTRGDVAGAGTYIIKSGDLAAMPTPLYLLIPFNVTWSLEPEPLVMVLKGRRVRFPCVDPCACLDRTCAHVTHTATNRDRPYLSNAESSVGDI